MKNLQLNLRMYQLLAIITCSITGVSALANLFGYPLLDLNKGGLLILMTISSLINYYRFKIKVLESKMEAVYVSDVRNG